LFFWRRLPILYLASGDIDHQLGGLVEVARALGVLRHAWKYGMAGGVFPRLSSPATIKLTHYPGSLSYSRWAFWPSDSRQVSHLSIKCLIARGS
jgi:hypothetical protein